MTITVHCPKCKSGAKVGSKKCKKCEFKFSTTNRKYRVVVKLPNGKRKSKLVESVDIAKKVEAKLKIGSVENGMLNVHKSPMLNDVWNQYLTWAKTNKKSWTKDQGR